MQCLWHKKEPIIIYVPITGINPKPYKEKWNDISYLQTVISFATNDVFLTETMQALSKLRDGADEAKTADELKGYNCAIKIIKNLICSPAIAKAKIDADKKIKEANDNE